MFGVGTLTRARWLASRIPVQSKRCSLQQVFLPVSIKSPRLLSQQVSLKSPNPLVQDTPLKFDNAKAAHCSKTFVEVLRAYTVLQLCQIPFIVANGRKLISLTTKIFGKTITYKVVEVLFFRHFCGGTDGAAATATSLRLNKAGVGAIFDYAAEEDVDSIPKIEKVEASPGLHVDKDGIISARVYDYVGEAECDARVNVFLDCIDAASKQECGFLAIKMTALGKPDLLERWSRLLLATKALFHKFDLNNDGKLDLSEFMKALPSLGLSLSDEEASLLFNHFDAKSHGGVVDYLEWTRRLNITDLQVQTTTIMAQIDKQENDDGGRPLIVPNRPKSDLATKCGLQLMDAEESQLFDNLLRRVDKLAAAAAEKGVRLLVDAEQTYFQPCVDHVVFRLQRRHNTFDRPFPIIYNTYQMYLKYSEMRAINDLDRSIRNNFNFAGKFVRGAYMVSERQRAHTLGYESPIFETKAETDRNYDSVLNTVLQRIASEPPLAHAAVLVASHNQQSIEHM